MMRTTMLIALLAACGSVSGGKKPDGGGSNKDSQSSDGGQDDDGAKSGTRLKLQWITYDDGTRQLAGIMDTMLGKQCYPSTINGSMYCVAGNTASSDGYYSDSGCTQAVVPWYYCNAQPPDYVYQYDTSNPCQSTVAGIYQRGSEVSIPSGLAYYKSGTTCEQVNFGTNYTFYSLGASVPITTFAAISKAEPTGSGLGVVSYTSSDGMVYPFELHDSASNLDCYPESTGVGATTGVCEPEVSSSYAGYYSNSTCTTAVAETNSMCPEPGYAYTPGTCPGQLPNYFQIGSSEALSTYYYLNGTTCTSATTGTGESWYMLGAAVPTDNLTRAPDMVSGKRMQLIHYTSGSTRYRDYPLYDTTEQLECDSYGNGTSSYACLPIANYAYVESNYYYSDSACANAIDVVELYRESTSCAAPTLPKYVIKEPILPNGCSSTNYEVHTVGSPISTLYYKSGTTCTAYPLSSAYQYYTLGAEVPTSNFATATLMTDP